jgi:hypothetical protein
MALTQTKTDKMTYTIVNEKRSKYTTQNLLSHLLHQNKNVQND